jgi:hypothetical protein
MIVVFLKVINKVAQMNPTFRVVFFSTICITLCTFGTSLYLANQPHLSPEQTQIVDNCNKISMGGSLAVFGLLARRKLSA